MLVPMLCQPAIENDVIELPEAESRRLIEDAFRAHAAAELTVTGRGEGVAGVVSDLADDTLAITPTAAQRVDATSGSCDVRIAGSGTAFWFRADVRLADGADPGGAIVLDRPRRVLTHQRRRFWRASVRSSSTVSLGTDATSWHHGALLNISVCGLACRVAEHAGPSCTVGEKLRVRFRVDGGPPEADKLLDLAAEVRSAAPGSDPRQTIVRVMFDASSISQDDQRRLQQATGHCGDGK